MSPSTPSDGSTVPTGTQLVHGEAHDVGRPGQVHPLHVQHLHGGSSTSVMHTRPRGGRASAQDVAGAGDQLELVDGIPALVEDVDAHRERGRSLRMLVLARPRSARGIGAPVGLDDRADQPVTDDVDRRQLGEVDVLDVVEDVADVPQPARVPPGRSTWVTSPVTTILEPKPSRVRNIFICSGEVFCASSRMMKASLRVRPRM
jgi:hypothetical protein